MSSTKRGFVKAGGILAIVASSIALLFSLIVLCISFVINEAFIVEIFKADSDYRYVEGVGGSYYFELIDTTGVESEDEIIIKSEDIELMVTTVKAVVLCSVAYCLGMSIAEMVLAILILNKLNKNEVKKGSIIALLVVSLLTGGIITAGFMIVVLCLKDKKPTLENINEIAVERTGSDNNSNE